jgi:hypothetical protein
MALLKYLRNLDIELEADFLRQFVKLMGNLLIEIDDGRR